MKLKTYVINLLESKDRREYVLGEVAKYPFMDVTLLEAVSGKKLTEEETERLFDRKGFARYHSYYAAPGEIGCTLSHRKCYEALLSSEEEVALILEDDVSFVHPKDTESVLEKGVELLKRKDIDILVPVPRVCYYTRPKAVWGEYAVFPIHTAYETCAYLINRRGAERLLRMDRPAMVADDFRYMLKHGLKIRCISPPLAVGLSTLEQFCTDIPDREYFSVKQSSWMRMRRSVLSYIHKQCFLLATKMGWMVDKAVYDSPYK